MKIIRSFFLITICLCATNLLHAQEAIATPVKPAAIDTKQSPTPALQPGSTVVPQTAAENAKLIPDPKREENIKIPGQTEVKTIETKPDNTLKAEPVIVQPLVTPNTNTVKPVPVAKPVVIKQQQ